MFTSYHFRLLAAVLVVVVEIQIPQFLELALFGSIPLFLSFLAKYLLLLLLVAESMEIGNKVVVVVLVTSLVVLADTDLSLEMVVVAEELLLFFVGDLSLLLPVVLEALAVSVVALLRAVSLQLAH
jgi:hypothetical protein